MQPKKRPALKGASTPVISTKAQEPRRPVGLQTLGTARYEQLRRALHLLSTPAAR
ncbi:hypothetical protein [Archangium sp.]|uniref:hypothetical protein n=1 Tax=Archangium sp. TaxID=1872627 RepID=UPI00389AD629